MFKIYWRKRYGLHINGVFTVWVIIWHYYHSATKIYTCHLRSSGFRYRRGKRESEPDTWQPIRAELLWKTATIFFLSNQPLKQGIGLVYVMLDFIGIGLLELQGTQSRREIQNEKLSTVGVEPNTFRSRCRRVTNRATRSNIHAFKS